MVRSGENTAHLILINSSNPARSKDGAVVRALTPHQCGPGSFPGLGVICGLSLILILVLAPRLFLRFFFLHKNKISISNLIRKRWT